MADRYVIAAGGSWNNTATWSDTSGGAGGFSIPGPTDNVFVDSASGSLVIDTNTGCANFNATGHAATISGTSSINPVTGDTFTLSAAGTYTYIGNLTFTGANAAGDITITRAGKTAQQAYIFNGVSKTFKFADAQNIGAAGNLTVTNGTLDSQGFDITCGAFLSNNTNVRTITLTGSVVTCAVSTTPVIINGTNLTWATPAEIIISPSATFSSSPFSAGVFVQKLTISMSLGAAANRGCMSLSPNNAATIEIGELAVTGTPNSTVFCMPVIGLTANADIDKMSLPSGCQFVSNLYGTTRTVTTATNEISFDGCMIRDITISGGPAIATNSIDLGNNTGITFQNFGANTHEIVGVTLDNDGVALPSCAVYAFKEDAGELKQVSTVTSDAVTGAYVLPTPDNDAGYVVIALNSVPFRGDAMNGITPTVP